MPLPIIYLAEEPDGRESVIDGQQRLTSFFKFLDGELGLTALQMRRDLNGQKFSALDRSLQGKVRRTAIRTITVQKESHEELKFEIFERLNTGSVALNDQELRNCVFRGPYNKLLCELATDQDFMFLVGIKRPEKRMRDVELVLRFAAFHHTPYWDYRPPIRRFLNDEMKRFRNITNDEAEDTRRSFKKAVQLVRSLLAGNAFKRFYRGHSENTPNGEWEAKRFNASLYDVLMYGFKPYDKNQIHRNLDAIREALISLMTDDREFIEAIELSTSAAKMVTIRFDKWRHAIERVVGSARSEPRCFSRALKDALFRADSTCALCSQRIMDVDDAAIDHIQQYWLGGQTIPENARLAHRFCNWARSRNDIEATGPSSPAR